MSEVKGSGQEWQAAMAQEQQRRATQVQGQGRQPGGATPHPRLGVAAKRSYPRPRSGAAAGRSYPISKELWLHGSRRDERSYSTFKIRKGGREEIPLIQGKEQRLCFAGAAMK